MVGIPIQLARREVTYIMTLNDYLKQNNISKYNLSKITGIPKTTIIDICAGRSEISKCSARTVQLLARGLGCTMEDIMDMSKISSYGG